MAVRAVNTCSLFRPSSPPLSSAVRFAALHFSSRHLNFRRRRRSLVFRPQHLFSSDYVGGGCQTQRRSVQSLFESVIEELQAMRKRRKRVSAASNIGLLNEELLEDRLGNRSLQKGLLLEFKKDSDRILLAVAQRPDGKKNSKILSYQITFFYNFHQI